MQKNALVSRRTPKNNGGELKREWHSSVASVATTIDNGGTAVASRRSGLYLVGSCVRRGILVEHRGQGK